MLAKKNVFCYNHLCDSCMKGLLPLSQVHYGLSSFMWNTVKMIFGSILLQTNTFTEPMKYTILLKMK